jgi:hypothetical protein
MQCFLRSLGMSFLVGLFTTVFSTSCKSRSFNKVLETASPKSSAEGGLDPNPFEAFAPKLSGAQVAAIFERTRAGEADAYSNEVYKPFVRAISQWIDAEQKLKEISKDEIILSGQALGVTLQDWKDLQTWLPQDFLTSKGTDDELKKELMRLSATCPVPTHLFCESLEASARAPKSGAKWQIEYFAKRLKKGEGRWASLEEGVAKLTEGFVNTQLFPEVAEILAFCGEAKRIFQAELLSCMKAPLYTNHNPLLPGVSLELSKVKNTAENLLRKSRVNKNQMYFLLRDLTCLNSIGSILLSIKEQDFDHSGARLGTQSICQASKAYRRAEAFSEEQVRSPMEEVTKTRRDKAFDLLWPVLGVAVEAAYLVQNPALSEFVPVVGNTQFGYKDFNDLTPFPLFVLGVDLNIQTEFDNNKGDSSNFFVHDAAHLLTALQSSHADFSSTFFNSVLNVKAISDSLSEVQKSEPLWKKATKLGAVAGEISTRNLKSFFLEKSRSEKLIASRSQFYQNFWKAFQNANPSQVELDVAHEFWFDMNHEGVADSVITSNSDIHSSSMRAGNYWQAFTWRSLNSVTSYFSKSKEVLEKMKVAFLKIEPSFKNL